MVQATVTLYKDIGLDSNYNRTMLFDSKTEQNTWFNSISSAYKYVMDDVNYNKLQNSFAIHEPIGDVYGYTYVRIQNMDDSGRTYYGFISDVILVDEETTRFNIIIDPIQTFMAEWSLGECYVIKEHCDRWSTGDEPIRVIPGQEGINANMVVSNVQELNHDTGIEGLELCYGILIFTSNRKYYAGARDKEYDNQIYYGIIPLCRNEENADKQLYYSYCYDLGTSAPTLMYKKIPTFREFVSGTVYNMLGIDPEAILGAFIIPQIGGAVNIYNYEDSYAITLFHSNTQQLQHYFIDPNPGTDPSYTAVMPIVAWGDTGQYETDTYAIQCLTLEDIVNLMGDNAFGDTITSISLPSKPTDGAVSETKYEPALYMYPYTLRSLITNGAITANIPDVAVFENKYLVDGLSITIGTSVKANGVQHYIYMGARGMMGTRRSRNELISIGAASLADSNTVDVLGDAYLSYCMQQRDSDRKMMWSSIAANVINQAVFMGYGGALVGSRSNSGRNDPMKGGDVDFGGVQGNLSSAMSRAVGWGVGASLVTSTIQGVDMWVQQEAKEQTIRNTPPDTICLGSGAGIIDSGEFGYYFVERVCDDVNYETAYDRFRHYGYTVNSMETPNLKSRKYYNYICTATTTIKGAIPADIKQDIVKIFEKGITFFHADHCDTTDYPTNTTGQELENIERSLIS